ncbi:hypothetical protein [Ensifer sp. LC163]|uniref:hypothetical protein n=1 Tax=Ensifer sp. LC163 TaxID=1120652 RepID=UPI00081305C8|nr:hypothetical protein [Ensifer sp. LC163]OCP36136.1 hypothetical protein BC360_25695 [Ensifer sp. LC163]
MRALVLVFVRLGPTFVYAAGAIFAASIILLAMFPSSPFTWWLYLMIRPVLRLPMFTLLGIPGMDPWLLLSALVSLAVAGVFLARNPKRYLRARFVHAHIALLALISANTWASRAEASSLGPSVPGGIDWTLAMPATMLGTVLMAIAALSCLSCHSEIVRRIRRNGKVARLKFTNLTSCDCRLLQP